MESTSPQHGARPSAGQRLLSPLAWILLPISCGLAGGYLDVAIIVLKKYLWNGPKNFGNGADFPWSVPVGHMLVLLIPGLLLAVVGWLRPRPLSLRANAWFFVTVAIWLALLRLPIYAVGSLFLAAGVGMQISRGVVAVFARPRQALFTFVGLIGLLVILAGLSSGLRAVRKSRTVAALPAAPPNARNVILIVWDAVRAASLSLHDYPRDTTPNLVRWARNGVRYNVALAPAPWTYPSHTSFFTGHWPFELSSQSRYSLDAPVPTLAEHLTSRGYQTAGFAANTKICTYETRLDRGFSHFEDYPLTARALLSRTVAGSWILENIFYRDDFYESKWISIQSRNATAVNRSFLDWLADRRRDRPFFAYLNYFDAHEPYVPPEGFAGRFGIRPRLPRDFRSLLDYASPGWSTVHEREIVMARDCYDDCISFLDDQLGQLLDQLESQGVLDDTLVIITSDHGEAFYEHGSFLHGNSLYLEEIAVPLVILAPNAPAGRVVTQPVSLRDLPATVIDQSGLSAGSPFPGHSLAAYWHMAPESTVPDSKMVLSEFADKSALKPQVHRDLSRYGVQMSLMGPDKHYTFDGFGSEELFDLNSDPLERVNVIDSDEGKHVARIFRTMLLDELDASPGSTEVENAYLNAFRQRLRSLVKQSPAPGEAITALEKRSN
jgi:arylsulfatase A-like enzyme